MLISLVYFTIVMILYEQVYYNTIATYNTVLSHELHNISIKLFQCTMNWIIFEVHEPIIGPDTGISASLVNIYIPNIISVV